MKIQKILSSILVGVVVILVLSFQGSPVDAYDIPQYHGLVNDFAEVLSAEFEAELETQLMEVANATNGAEIAVITITSLEGDTIENVAREFGETWGVGKEESDNGVVFLSAIEDRKMRIHTGYGIEAYLTDAATGRIRRNEISPHYKNEDYEAGVQAGVDAMLLAISDPDLFASTSSSESANAFKGFFGLIALMFFLSFVSGGFVYLAAFFGRSEAWWPGGLVGGVIGSLLGRPFGSMLPTILAFGLFGLALDYILSKNYKTWKLQKKATNWGKTMGGFSSGSSRSSGGFSMGGGSFGGGGSSGGW